MRHCGSSFDNTPHSRGGSFDARYVNVTVRSDVIVTEDDVMMTSSPLSVRNHSSKSSESSQQDWYKERSPDGDVVYINLAGERVSCISI